MTLENITAITSVLALVISLYTLFITKLKQFKGLVIPARRIVLSWEFREEGDLPCVFIECQFLNAGARPGKIEDVIVQLTNTDGGERLPYQAFLSRDEDLDTYIEEGEEGQPLRTFSSVWLRAEESRNISILFKPSQPGISFQPHHKYEVSMVYSGDNIRTFYKGKFINWCASPVKFSFSLSEKEVEEWQNRQTVQPESFEFHENRKEGYLLAGYS